MMKVLLLSRYGQLGASSRVRFFQYMPYLESQNVEVIVKPLLSDAYLSAIYKGGHQYREVVRGFCLRFFALFSAHRFDLVLIEKEVFPYMPAFAELFFRLRNIPYVVDFDDAIFHNYDLHPVKLVQFALGKKIDAVMQNACAVIAGNQYLANRAKNAGANAVTIIPTVVDLKRYNVKPSTTTEEFVVGWIGTPKTSRYLLPFLSIFESLKKDFNVRFVAVGAQPQSFPAEIVEIWEWTEESEATSIQRFDIGIMPLDDSPWEKGKCGYKLIQYLACGVPVIASPIGVNCEIVQPGVNGCFASSREEWEESLRQMLNMDRSALVSLGLAGRRLVEERYSLQVQAPKFLTVLQEVAR